MADAETVKKAKDALAKAKTKDDVTKVWSEFFGDLGHRALGRILIGTYDAWAAKQASK